MSPMLKTQNKANRDYYFRKNEFSIIITRINKYFKYYLTITRREPMVLWQYLLYDFEMVTLLGSKELSIFVVRFQKTDCCGHSVNSKRIRQTWLDQHVNVDSSNLLLRQVVQTSVLVHTPMCQ
jgi:hypothetical protein